MTKADIADAIVPHLIAALPNPFSPDEVSVERVLKAAEKWAELIEAHKRKGKKVVTMTLG